MKKQQSKEPLPFAGLNSAVTTGELAQLFGVSVRTIQRLSQSGALVPSGRTREGNIYDLAAAVQTYCKLLEAKAESKNTADRKSQLIGDKLRAEIALKQSQTELHQLKASVFGDTYLSLDEARRDYIAFYRIFERFAFSIPRRLICMVSDYVEPVVAQSIEKNLQREIAGILRTFTVADMSPPTEGSKKRQP